MIAYIVKTVLCASALFLIYVLLLEREKMHRFNRFYLLFSIVFSLTVAFITIKSRLPVAPVSEMIMPINQASIVSTTSDLQQVSDPAPIEESILLPNLLLLIYIVVTAFLLFRFIRNLSMLLFKAIRNKSGAYHGATLVLTNDDAIPHSFLKYIFIDKEKFEQGTIEKEILQHELTHVKQKHSIDVLMVELLLVFAWVNPLLYLYRKAMLLNHEYLADEAVVNAFNDTKSYQLLLFNKVSQTNNLVLSSPFNYLITKKRLIMMTRKTSQKVAVLKQIALIPLIAAIGFLFSTRVIAQDNSKQQVKQTQLVASKTDATQSVVDEYHAFLKKYNIRLGKASANKNDAVKKPNINKSFQWTICTKSEDTFKRINKADRARMEQLYFQMSKKQQNHEFLGFWAKPELLPKLVPTKEQMELWKNPKNYGIWFERAKRVKNTELNKHSNTEFYHYALRKLDKVEAGIMKYQVEVALLTKEQFEKTRTRTLALWSKDQYKSELFIMMKNDEILLQGNRIIN